MTPEAAAAPIAVGVVDSGCGARHASRVAAARRFGGDGTDFAAAPAAVVDRIGHGGFVCGAILRGAPMARLSVAQVFHERGATGAEPVAAAIDWLAGQGVRLINLSLGLRTDRTALREACARALRQGIVLFAASPARGEPVFPAAYPGVVRVTGDARCDASRWTWLDTAQADFGAVVKATGPGPGAPAGASIACAALCGHAAAWLAGRPQAGRAELLEHLRRHAAFHGPERRALERQA